MENTSFINLHRTRDFSNKMNATFWFVRQNFKGLFKSILFIAGPPILIVSILMATFFSEFFGLMKANATNPEVLQEYVLSVNFWLQIIAAMVLVMISSVMTISTVNNYIVLYDEKKSSDISVDEVWQRVRSSFWMYMGTVLLFVLTGFVFYLVLLIPAFVLGAIAPVLVMFAILFVFIAMIYCFISVSLTFFIRSYEKRGFFESLTRSFRLVQGKWWSTFGLLFVFTFILMILSYFIMIPFSIFLQVKASHTMDPTEMMDESTSTMAMIYLTLYYLVQLLLYALPNIALAFQYFNLVELKESRGLLSQIENIGQGDNLSAAEEQY